MTNNSLVKDIYQYLRAYFKTTPFKFINESQVRTITGQEEGTNAWISANYFLGNFKSVKKREF
jgi:hypothetical protein